jgi:hypothetical protein
MEAERRRRWKMQAARDEIRLDQRAACWRRGLPDGERRLAALGVVAIRLVIGNRTWRGRVNWRWLFSSHSPRERRAPITRPWSQPAWQRTSTFPSSASWIDRLGLRSS